MSDEVFWNVPFYLLTSDGDFEVAWLHGMLLTNSCDCLRKDWLQFAALMPIALMEGDEQRKKRMKENRLFEFFYLPDSRVEDYVVDLGRIVSIPRKLFEAQLSKGKTKREFSLTWVGCYIFICKLTVFFMHRESDEVETMRL